MDPALTLRLQRIQIRLGTDDDGLLGPGTLGKIEAALDLLDKLRPAPVPAPPATPALHNLTVSEKTVEKIIEWECSDRRTYEKTLSHPTWPGGNSGVTIGIGYDVGYYTKETIAHDWAGLLSDSDIARLQSVSGLKGSAAKAALGQVRDIDVTWEKALKVFHLVSVPKYARSTAKAYPGINRLPPDAQGMLLSITYNRGVPDPEQPARFQELFEIKRLLGQSLVLPELVDAIAAQVVKSKRLWVGKGLDGLLGRRDEEARIIRASIRTYQPSELVDA